MSRGTETRVPSIALDRSRRLLLGAALYATPFALLLASFSTLASTKVRPSNSKWQAFMPTAGWPPTSSALTGLALAPAFMFALLYPARENAHHSRSRKQE